MFSSDDVNVQKARALGFEHDVPYYIVNGCLANSANDDTHSYSFQVTLRIHFVSFSSRLFCCS